LIALTASGPAGAQLGRRVYTSRLANGLTVVACPDPGGIDVSVVVRYNVGARDEPGGLEGMAHLVEHLMFAGSKHIASGEILRRLMRAGATNLNGVTSDDSTVFFETLPPEQIELALWIESDRMG